MTGSGHYPIIDPYASQAELLEIMSTEDILVQTIVSWLLRAFARLARDDYLLDARSL